MWKVFMKHHDDKATANISGLFGLIMPGRGDMPSKQEIWKSLEKNSELGITFPFISSMCRNVTLPDRVL